MLKLKKKDITQTTKPVNHKKEFKKKMRKLKTEILFTRTKKPNTKEPDFTVPPLFDSKDKVDYIEKYDNHVMGYRQVLEYRKLMKRVQKELTARLAMNDIDKLTSSFYNYGHFSFYIDVEKLGTGKLPVIAEHNSTLQAVYADTSKNALEKLIKTVVIMDSL